MKAARLSSAGSGSVMVVATRLPGLQAPTTWVLKPHWATLPHPGLSLRDLLPGKAHLSWAVTPGRSVACRSGYGVRRAGHGATGHLQGWGRWPSAGLWPQLPVGAWLGGLGLLPKKARSSVEGRSPCNGLLSI